MRPGISKLARLGAGQSARQVGTAPPPALVVTSPPRAAARESLRDLARGSRSAPGERYCRAAKAARPTERPAVATQEAWAGGRHRALALAWVAADRSCSPQSARAAVGRPGAKRARPSPLNAGSARFVPPAPLH